MNGALTSGGAVEEPSELGAASQRARSDLLLALRTGSPVPVQGKRRRSREPEQRPGVSKQDYGTPRDFLEAVQARFGRLDVDLAARPDNAKAPLFVTPEMDSLTVPWGELYGGLNAFLNPPYGATGARLSAWMAKAAYEAKAFRRGRLFVLTPAAVGSRWYAESVAPHAFVMPLTGRLTFEGESQPFPKDCMLSVYGAGLVGFAPWDWRKA